MQDLLRHQTLLCFLEASIGLHNLKQHYTAPTLQENVHVYMIFLSINHTSFALHLTLNKTQMGTDICTKFLCNLYMKHMLLHNDVQS